MQQLHVTQGQRGSRATAACTTRQEREQAQQQASPLHVPQGQRGSSATAATTACALLLEPPHGISANIPKMKITLCIFTKFDIAKIKKWYIIFQGYESGITSKHKSMQQLHQLRLIPTRSAFGQR